MGKLAVADEILAPDFVMHSPGMPSELAHGPEGLKRLATAMRMAFPGLQTTHEDTIAEEDKVVIRWTLSSTHTGPWLGIPPTAGRSVFQGSTSSALWTASWWNCGRKPTRSVFCHSSA